MARRRLSVLLCAALFSTTFTADATTVAVTPGFGDMGIIVVDSSNTPVGSYFTTVGHYVSVVFTELGGGAIGIVGDGKVRGKFSAGDPVSLNGKAIHLFVGNGVSVETSTSYLVLEQAGYDIIFPRVDVAGATTFYATYGYLLSPVVEVNAEFLADEARIRLNPDPPATPEPSSTLLGLLGLLSFLRRRPRRGS